jgi:predicted  nucleic acid-binding Zn-ribbon protein
MPNKCTKCGKLHPDNAAYLLEDGCDQCGSKFFFFIREEALREAEMDVEKLSDKEVEEIEQDIREIVSEKEGETIPREETVILDVEAIRVIKPGKYRIDVTNLFSQKPIVIRVGPGKYELDLSVLMSRFRKKEKK